MSKMKNLYTEEQETAAEEMLEEMQGWDTLTIPRLRQAARSGVYDTHTRFVVEYLLSEIDKAEATRLEDMRRTTALLLNVIQAAQYWRERCQS
jgi:hypothetical protein